MPREARLLTLARGETILLVEDDEHLRAAVLRSLRADGYRVIDAGDGESAVELAAAYGGKIDLLLTDVTLPAMNGRELSEQLLAHRPDMKVLFMSGHHADVILLENIAEGRAAFLEKPFSTVVLTHKVRDVIRGRSGTYPVARG